MNAISQIQSEPTALTVIPAAVVSTIIAADKDDILGAYAAKVRAFKPDISTPKGRDETRSLAAEGRRVKASLLRLAGGLKEDAIKTQRAINAEERVLEERMDALIANIRAPLTEYENVEKARVKAHEDALLAMQDLAGVNAESSVAIIDARIEALSQAYDRDWQHDFTARAADVYQDCRNALLDERARTVKREAEAAELARLRSEAEERARQDAARAKAEHEARIAREAAEKARLDAEAKAERERQETLRAAAEERARIEREAQEKEDQARRDRERLEAAAAESERRHQEQVRKAEADRQAAAKAAADAAAQRDRERIEAADRAKRDRDKAIQDERDRVAAEAERERKRVETERLAAERKAQDKAHRARINNEALNAIVLAMSEVHSGNAAEAAVIGKSIVTAIASGAVPHVRVEY